MATSLSCVSFQPTLSLLYDLIASVAIVTESEVLKLLSIKLRSPDQSQVTPVSLSLIFMKPRPSIFQTLDFLVDKDDVEDLVLYIQGYYYLLTRTTLEVRWEEDLSDPSGMHDVFVS